MPESNRQRLPTASPLPRRTRIAGRFHEEYEHLAKLYGWTTQEASQVKWADLPVNQRALMIHVIGNLEAMGVIVAGPNA